MEKERLEQLVNIKTGKLNANASDENGVYPFFTCSKETLRINKYSYDCECVLVAGNGDLNAKYYNGKFDAYQRTYILTNKDKDKLNLKYLYYFMQNYVETLRNQSIGGVIKYIKLENLTEAKINLVSLERQEEIINTLQKAEEIINERKRQIENLQILVKSQFVEMFGEISNSKYQTVKLSSIADVGSSHRVFTTEFVENGIPFYRGTEIGMLANGEKPKNCYYISKEHYLKICDENTKPKIGDLLLPSICNKGQVWMVNTSEPFYYKDGRVLSISPKEGKINHKYFHQFLKYKTIEEYSKLGSGSTFAEFKIFILKDFDVILPPIELQNKFASFVEQIDKQEFEELKSEKLLKNLIDEGAKNVKF